VIHTKPCHRARVYETDAGHPCAWPRRRSAATIAVKAILLICPPEAKPDEPRRSCCTALQRETAPAGKGAPCGASLYPRGSGDSCSTHPRNARVAGVPFLTSATVRVPSAQPPTKPLHSAPSRARVERTIAPGVGGQFDHCGLRPGLLLACTARMDGLDGRPLIGRIARTRARARETVHKRGSVQSVHGALSLRSTPSRSSGFKSMPASPRTPTLSPAR
jgi:hypothetical protein